MALRYNSYFDKLPKIQYDINRSLIAPKYVTSTNIFFRIRYIQEVLNNINSYFVAEVEDNETPEIIAEKAYGDAGAAWMITIANQIIDPQWEWPLSYNEFQKYIVNKYGSQENALTTYHHYEMLITRTLNPDNITTEKRYRINDYNLIENILSVPFNYYYPKVIENLLTTDSTLVKIDSTLYTVDQDLDVYERHDFSVLGLQPGSLAFTQYVNNYDVDGKTIVEVIKGNAVTNYEWEEEQNEQKRLIKIVKKEYYDQIQDEFTQITGSAPAFLRRVV